MKNLTILLAISFVIILISCSSSIDETKNDRSTFITPLGLEKKYPTPSEKLTQQYEAALADFQQNPNDVENIIWLGRRLGYLGHYEEAIEVYTKGISKFPNNPRLYRHRGHRLISIRKYDEAIRDFEKAVILIDGTQNEIEADGMPNARNIPVSSLHGNIYYHLGLAYYLVHDYERAYDAYLSCRNSGSNPDNIVSSTHWLYMIQRKLGNTAKADSELSVITDDFDIIENHDYYTLCKFYKGLVPIDSIVPAGDTPSSDALKYGVANWHFYNNDKDKAAELFKAMLEGNSWTSFGYLAAESDLVKYYN